MSGLSISDLIRRLASEKCEACDASKVLSNDEANARLKLLPGWTLEGDSIQKQFRFRSYLLGLEFACSLGRIAEAEDHHPDMLVGWRRVRVTLSTHAIRGLSNNDFIMAAKSELEYAKHNSD